MSRVSYVMMNPGGDRELTAAVRDALDELVGELRRRRRRRPRARPRGRARRQPDHAPHRARHRSHAARVGAVRAGHRRGGRRAGRATSTSTCRPPRSTPAPCIAGHVGADTAAAMLAEGPHRGDDDAAARRRRHQRRDRARRPQPPVRRVEPDRAGVRGRADQLRAAGDGRRDRAGAHRPRHARAAFKVIGSDLWSDDPGFDEAASRRRHRRVRLGHHRRRSPRCSSPGSIDADGTIRGEMADAHAARRPRRPHVRLRAVRADGTPPDDHAERRAGDPARQGRAAGRHRAARRARRVARRSPTSASPARSVPTSTRSTRWCSGSCPTARSTACARSATRPAPAPCRRCCRGSCGPRWRPRCVDVDQDRDRDRAALPGAVRRRDGVPARHAPVAAPGDRGRPARARHATRIGRGRRRRRAEPATADVAEDCHGGRVMNAPVGRRGGGRAGRQASRAAAVVDREPFLTRTLKPVELVSAEGLEILEHNADTILEEVGVEVRDYPSAREAVRRRRRRRRRQPGAVPARACAARSCRRPRRPCTPSTPATPPTTCRSVATPPCSRPTTARRSCTTSTAAAATRRSRTSRTS